MIHLKSVATKIDPSTGTTYAVYIDGSIDKDSATCIYDCSKDWWGALSPEDANTVAEIMTTLD